MKIPGLKSFSILVLFVFEILGIFSCSPYQNSSSSNSGSMGPGTFWALDMTDPNNLFYYQLTAQLLYSGAHCLVYVDDNSLNYVTLQEISNTGQEFDTNVYNLDTGIYGSIPDVDNTGKVTILIYDIPGGSLGNGSYFAGFFDFNQLYSGQEGQNGKNMIYMNNVPGIPATTPGNELFDQTTAHELQHMINYYQRVMVHAWSEEDTWINEGLSVSTEGLYELSKNLLPGNDDRVSYYNNTSYNRLIAAGTSFYSWSEIYENYVTDFLFFQWLRIQSGGSLANNTPILRTIRDNPAPDYTAVVSAVNSNISSLSSANWQTILGNWYIANALCESGGLWGYSNAISVIPPIYSHTSANIAPGSGIYSLISSSGTGSVNPTAIVNIYYAGINQSNNAADTNGTSYSGNILLAYNVDANLSDSGIPVSGLPNASIVSASGILMDKTYSIISDGTGRHFPIDFIVGRNGKKPQTSGKLIKIKPAGTLIVPNSNSHQ